MAGFGTRNDLAALVTVLDSLDTACGRAGVDSARVKSLVFLDLYCTLNVEDHLKASCSALSTPTPPHCSALLPSSDPTTAAQRSDHCAPIGRQ